MGKPVIFSVINQKGGVNKTTISYNLGYLLAQKGLKVLMVDLDPQANLTILCGIEPSTLERSIADVLISYTKKERVSMDECILQISENLFVAGSIIDLSAADTLLQGTMSREYVLKKALNQVSDMFDIIIIDCQPSLSLLPLNALACSTHVIVPCSTQYLAYRGLGLIEDTLERVKENLNENLAMYGVIATMVENTLHSKEILEFLEKEYNVIGTIPKSVKVSDAAYSQSGAITEFAPNSKPARAYEAIADKVYKDFGFAQNA